jgi:outer membrane protein assembly factor BamA
MGLGFSHANIGDYTGKLTNAVGASGGSVKGLEAPTRLREDCDAHRIVGCDGGWDNMLRLALAFDTRDFEPDPNSGVFADVAADFGTGALGSKYDYVRAMAAVRGYYSPIPKLADLVLAGRGVYEVASRGEPFFSMDIFPFTEDPRSGLGGARTLRGFKGDRFVGPVMVLANAEVRWTFWQTRFLDQRFAFMGVPFLDMGRAFDAVRRTSFAGWNRSQGFGFRIAWNLATIIMVDYGVSSEDTGLYINFAHIF